MQTLTTTNALAALVTLCLSQAMIGCSADSASQENVGTSGQDSTTEAPSVFVRGGPVLDSSDNSVSESATFRGEYGHASSCHAYKNGTAADAAACDHFPTNYAPLNCIGESTTPGSYITQCLNTYLVGSAPYDRDGTYAVTVINADNPEGSGNREVTDITVFKDAYQVYVLGKDEGLGNTFAGSLNVLVAPGSTTTLSGSLHVTVQAKASSIANIAGCAAAYSTTGMTAAQIAQEDAHQLALCAKPTALVEGRAGWVLTKQSDNIDFLTYDATPILAKGEHVVFAFAVDGHTESYLFDN